MKKVRLLFLLIGLPQLLLAQSYSMVQIDSMLQRLPKLKEDTNKCILIGEIANGYLTNGNNDKSIAYWFQSQTLAQKIGWKTGVMKAKEFIGICYAVHQQLAEALTCFQDAYKLAQELKDKNWEVVMLGNLGNYYLHAKKNYAEALSYYLKANQIASGLNNRLPLAEINGEIGGIYLILEEGTKALPYHFKSLTYFQSQKYKPRIASANSSLGEDYQVIKDYDKAIVYYEKALVQFAQLHDKTGIANMLNKLAYAYILKKDYNQAYPYLSKCLQVPGISDGSRASHINTAADFYLKAPDSILLKAGVKPKDRYQKVLQEAALSIRLDTSDQSNQRDNYEMLYQAYQHQYNYPKAYYAYQRFINLRDSLAINRADAMKFTEKMGSYQEAKKEEALRYQQQLANIKVQQQKRFYLVGIISLAVISFFIIFNYLNQRKANKEISKANHLLNEQQKEITKQRDKLSETITDLKQTQTQLIQSEKMASLGELTAGIAHEIQNPLNFVNNFSDVSIELLDEMEEELEKGDVKEASSIAIDIKQNLEKINHHGKRADFIVKGMLQHSRANTGERQPTNINALADEFFKLSYHGLRAKDQSFNATLVTNFDPSLPKISVVQQDIGRVLLNLFNNAFYAVQQKQKTDGTDYKPEVTVDTSFTDTFLTIKVKDNGIGIPDLVKDKIMQPFFTTKPTGEGTGLGLSLSYDIVVKGHGGSININSEEGKGSEFLINLPLQA